MAKTAKLDLIGLLSEHGALLDGHFRLASGMHSANYVQTALILQYPHIAQKLAKAIASKFFHEIDCVCSPAMGAVVIGQEVARAKKCRAIFTERVNGVMVLRREFHINKGEKLLVVEDVLTTGRSTGEVVNLTRTHGAKVVGVAAIIDRSVVAPTFEIPFRSLISYPLEIYPADNCELCKKNVPLTSPGSRYLEPNP
ncbi:MAG: orotate phosphoribosyltransferase [Elusimicrobia bacterium]|nr:orotate phosphoribosyltransferase [Elusimicrobiota bacterium]